MRTRLANTMSKRQILSTTLWEPAYRADGECQAAWCRLFGAVGRIWIPRQKCLSVSEEIFSWWLSEIVRTSHAADRKSRNKGTTWLCYDILHIVFFRKEECEFKTAQQSNSQLWADSASNARRRGQWKQMQCVNKRHKLSRTPEKPQRLLIDR